MFQRGETVLYGSEGVCRIAEIQEMKIGRTKAEYYVLKPVYRESATIYVPVDNPTLVARMKHVLSQQEIDRLLEIICFLRCGLHISSAVVAANDPRSVAVVHEGQIAALGIQCGIHCLRIRHFGKAYLNIGHRENARERISEPAADCADFFGFTRLGIDSEQDAEIACGNVAESNTEKTIALRIIRHGGELFDSGENALPEFANDAAA